jgi:hypothetical protein
MHFWMTYVLDSYEEASQNVNRHQYLVDMQILEGTHYPLMIFYPAKKKESFGFLLLIINYFILFYCSFP